MKDAATVNPQTAPSPNDIEAQVQLQQDPAVFSNQEPPAPPEEPPAPPAAPEEVPVQHYALIDFLKHYFEGDAQEQCFQLVARKEGSEIRVHIQPSGKAGVTATYVVSGSSLSNVGG